MFKLSFHLIMRESVMNREAPRCLICQSLTKYLRKNFTHVEQIEKEKRETAERTLANQQARLRNIFIRDCV